MKRERVEELRDCYRRGLLEDVIPFWLTHGLDHEMGGVFTCLDRDGSIYDTDKCVWFQGRFGWIIAHMVNTIEKNDAWLYAAKSCVEFLRAHAYDDDGRMFFHLTREGAPIRKRRYAYSESFAAIAYAAYARAADSGEYGDLALHAYERFVDHMCRPGQVPPKFTDVRPARGAAPAMIGIATAQVLRENLGRDELTKDIDTWIEEIERGFMNHELKAMLEVAGPDGEFIDHSDGRMLNPGHAIEAAWFILREAQWRGNDAELIRIGTTILDWMWEWGWDREFGGIIYFRDVKGKPVQEYWHDMKFWWPQCEAIIAALLAYRLTGDKKYAEWHTHAHEWTHANFPDPVHGEWFGYLHRDGRLSNRAKGTLYKGPFHIPRMQIVCGEILAGLA